MSFDVSRVTFDPWKDFHSPVMEQGRVQLDSDWNEWLAEVARRIRAGTLDTLGRAVYPATTPNAFLITPAVGSVTIGVGRMYVDGLLVENHGLPAPGSGGWTPPAVTPPASAPSWDPALDELVGPDAVDYLQQPYFPGVATQAPFPTSGGPFLVYLDVWQRAVTFLQYPDLVEKAVGVDTTGRIQTVWQVRILDLGSDSTATCATEDSDIPAWKKLIQPSAGRLTTGVVQSSSPGPCCLAPNTGYTGMENQLYRVEIHQAGVSSSSPAAIQPGSASSPGTATFKWSRNNASLLTAVTGISGGTLLTVQSTGKDEVLRFNKDDWVEITDDWLELNGLPGELRQISLVTPSANTILLKSAVTATSFPVDGKGLTDAQRHTRLIKWDQTGKVYQNDGTTVWWDLDAQGTAEIPVPPSGTSLILENGATVSFDLFPADGTFHAADYWNFAARTFDGTIESLIDAPPAGIHHHYARLAIPGGSPTDCRIKWPPDCGGCCTVNVEPGDDIQAALDSLPEEGGCVCLKTGVHAITSTLRLRSSNVLLHGESPGAIVRAGGVSPRLLIGDPDLPITDVAVEEIRFEATAPAHTSIDTFLYLENCARVRIERCALVAVASDTGIGVPVPGSGITTFALGIVGVTVSGGTDVRLLANRMDNVSIGVLTQDFDGELCVAENTLQSTTGTFLDQAGSSTGQYGVLIQPEHTKACRIENNRIDDFRIGIMLRPNAKGSRVTGNEIRRRGGVTTGDFPPGAAAMRDYLDRHLYAIDVWASGCEVRANRIDLQGAAWGGIRARGAHSILEGNVLEAAPPRGLTSPLPAGIYCLADAKNGLAADHSEVRENRLLGAQTGIVVSRISGPVITGNHVDGGGAGWYGVLADDCVESRIENNDVREVFFAFHLGEGERNRVTGCRAEEVLTGVTALRETDMELTGNVLRTCLAAGVALIGRGSTALLNNRLANCGFVGTLSIGIGILAEELFGSTGALTRIADCEVLDTGLSPDGKPAASSSWIGIGGWVPACQITDNRVGYTQRAGHSAQGEHRALLLLGPYDKTGSPGVSTWPTFGSALLSGNHFSGPGLTALVEFLRPRGADLRFEKVTFNDNLCDHLMAKPSDLGATVLLWGRHLIASGNHVKATPHVTSMFMNDKTAIALVTGNVTTGEIKITAATPPSIVHLNIQIP
jgi:hypothetical protein